LHIRRELPHERQQLGAGRIARRDREFASVQCFLDGRLQLVVTVASGGVGDG
jgi:hypothetical protein